MLQNHSRIRTGRVEMVLEAFVYFTEFSKSYISAGADACVSVTSQTNSDPHTVINWTYILCGGPFLGGYVK